VTPVLVRVDERLVHGQVVVGWIPVLGAERILIADDALLADAWERELVVSAAPPGVEVEVLSLEGAGKRLAGEIPGSAILLVRSIEAVAELARGGAPVTEVNLGGLHFRDGARRYLDYLYLTPADIEALKELAGRGIKLTARELPGSPGVELNPLLEEGRLDYDHLPVGRS
jgi:mannose/fructose/N-acetylgalactosamine-specific phosphotransferase system component IIB